MKQILITGGSDGIGRAAAQLLAAERAALTLVARDPAKLQAALGTLAGSGHRSLVADLSTPAGMSLVAKHIDENRYDAFINNAGAGIYGRFADLPLAQQLDLMHLNMDAVAVLAHHYLRQARRGDALVNTASTVGLTSLPGTGVYTATKAFVGILSETLWWEMKDRGVYVMSFNPGATGSSFHTAAGGGKDTFSSMQTPEAVAQELVRALRRRSRPRVVSGSMNRLLVFFSRLLPRKSTINLMGRFSPATAG
ncbi:SDR family NAD(P)-dependent oxidoreductase [Hymenobacter jeollabukensis]|uniref:SDR family NAD(P)-dependent oxidoreductase n=1 Tax=Hymenobacter jeollabukensis TaxID=2025313 RepID=A0A5R8WXW2_9BACT|nr:SDR family NAD(P)-dependent oxidoreductase [Hymenobacter jeollabukensis]TLM96985.1 SDR family NAD(P)-dependent oxidoreductase [Hymenobacter jeollabukensis]